MNEPKNKVLCLVSFIMVDHLMVAIDAGLLDGPISESVPAILIISKTVNNFTTKQCYDFEPN